MRLTEKALKEFEAIWREEYPDDKLSPEELREIATKVMRAHEVVFIPMPYDDD